MVVKATLNHRVSLTDTAITTSSAKELLSCDFESGLCNFKQVRSAGYLRLIGYLMTRVSQDIYLLR